MPITLGCGLPQNTTVPTFNADSVADTYDND